MKKSKIFEMELVSLEIKSLTNWLNKFESRHKSEIGKIKLKHLMSLEKNTQEALDDLTKSLAECRRKHDLLRLNHPRTVGDLVRIFPYSFTHKVVSGLGKASILELKQKLKYIGLTPDDWPALCHRNNFINELSKRVLLKLPLYEIFLSGRSYDDLYIYMGCKKEELESKKFSDFISIFPDARHQETKFFKNHVLRLISIRQRLTKKGFTSKDGKFFNWKPSEKEKCPRWNIARWNKS